MRYASSLALVISTWSAAAAANCTMHLVGDAIDASQAEFTRQYVQGALPTARDVTLVPVADLAAGVRAMGYSDARTEAFVDLVDDTLRTPIVRAADPDSALGRAARRLALAARNPRAIAACLVHQRCSKEVLLMFVARDALVGVQSANRPGQPTFQELVYRNIPDAPTPHALLLIEPAEYDALNYRGDLRRSLLTAMGTYDVLLTLHDWALAHAERLKARDKTGLVGYLNLNRRGQILIDEGFAHLLMFAQGTAVKVGLGTPDPRLGPDLTDNVKSRPKARALARRLGVDGLPAQMIEWSERTMARLHADLLGSSSTP